MIFNVERERRERVREVTRSVTISSFLPFLIFAKIPLFKLTFKLILGLYPSNKRKLSTTLSTISNSLN